MYSTAFGEHALISVAAWLLGIILGGGLGYGCALMARRILAASTGSGRYAALIPWRTVAVALLLFAPFIPVAVGLGAWAGILMTGLGVFVLAWMVTVPTLLGYWSPPSLTGRLVIGARSIAVASPIIAAGVSFLGGGGLGGLIWQGGPHPHYSVLALVVLLALVLDLALGVAQMLLSKPGPVSSKAPGA